jgi:MinD-like ATPase involved in chromosome partitioning or flagellar assembly
LDIKLRTTSDEGKPIVEEEPDHIISQKYMDIGSRIIEMIIKNKKVSPVITQ